MDLRQDLKLSNKRNIEIHIENMCKLSILSQFFEFFLTVILSKYSKVAPQNLMYDRRIVRGNTFAALVIPVNMQPDPALIEKQKMEEAYMR